jgi:queuosine precursor transporter
VAFSAALTLLEPGNDVSWATAPSALLGLGPEAPFWVSLAVGDWLVKLLLALVALLPFRLAVAKLSAKVA